MSASAPPVSVRRSPQRREESATRPSAQLIPEGGAPGTALPASKRSRAPGGHVSSSPGRSVTDCPAWSSQSLSLTRAPSRART